jgi:hypothetical protein|nr:hypothetical protein [Kofleriaceae bacterium]
MWKNLAIVLGLLCIGLAYRDCTRPSAATATASQPTTTVTTTGARHDWSSSSSSSRDGDDTARAGRGDGAAPEAAAEQPAGLRFNGIQLPAWTAYLAPVPGESLSDYKKRMLPLAEAAVQPQRDRVAAARDQLVAAAHLDATQRAALDKAAAGCATEIEDKLLDGALAGDFNPSTFKPMTGVSTARDVLDAIDRANQQFVSTLSTDQRAALAQQPFDFADYLLFSTRWEDALPF